MPWQRVPHVSKSLEEWLTAQTSPLWSPPPLDENPKMKETPSVVPQVLEEPTPELRRELRVPQPWSPMQRVRKRLLTDTVLPTPPPRQRPLQ